MQSIYYDNMSVQQLKGEDVQIEILIFQGFLREWRPIFNKIKKVFYNERRPGLMQ